VTPYPPGIPLLAPGERITASIVAYLQAGLAAGMHVTGAADPTLATLRVVR
jgi:lysine decarboxylase